MSQTHVYAAVIDATTGTIRITEYVSADEDDFIGISGDALAWEAASVDDAALVAWARREAVEWDPALAERIETLRIAIVRGQDPMQ
jgi:hypothetical protein